MTRREIPTRVVETGRMARGSSGQPTGWLQTLGDRANNLMAQLLGIEERVKTPFVNGYPACVTGERTFEADTNTTITIAAFPTDPDSVPPVAFVALTVNPIILAGETYRIPIIFSPPGVLHADKLMIAIEAGFTMFANVNRPGITPLNDYRQTVATGGFVDSPTADVIQYTWQQQVLGNFATVRPFLPFLWNIIDEKSGRQYAPTWMPNGALMNSRGNSRQGVGQHNDGEIFEFDTPWQFERDAQVSLLFRPIMNLYQIAAGDATLPFTGVDDRSGGRRFMQATVRAEFHGNRYYDMEGQDLRKEGAYVTSAGRGRPIDAP